MGGWISRFGFWFGGFGAAPLVVLPFTEPVALVIHVSGPVARVL